MYDTEDVLLHRRRGRWYLRQTEAEYFPGLRAAIQQTVELRDVRHDWAHDREEWYGTSPHFAVVEPNTEVPFYRWAYDPAAGTIIWSRLLSEIVQPSILPHGEIKTDVTALRVPAEGRLG